MCALKESSVELHSHYTHPAGYTVVRTLWFITWPSRREPDDLIQDERYRDRVNYTSNNKNNHTLSLKNLLLDDSNNYRFRFLTDSSGGKYSGGNLALSVTGLQVLVDPATVNEGDRVTLTCNTTCRLSNNPTYIWYRNSQPVTNKHTADNRLHIYSASPEDAGKYSCAVEGYQSLISPENTLSVRYAPRNTSVSVSPPADIKEGGSVTLTCSSDANPPAHTYTWYSNSPRNTTVSISPPGDLKEGDSVTLTCSSDANPPVENYTWYSNASGSVSEWLQQEGIYNITNITVEHTGHYYCKAENKYGPSNSSATYLDVQYSPRNTTVSISPSGDIKEGDSVTLNCSSDANPPVENYTWYKADGNKTVLHRTERIPSFTLILVSGLDGLYHCEAGNEVGKENSTRVQVWFSLPDSGFYKIVLFPVVGAICAVVLLLVVLICWRRQQTTSTKASSSAHSKAQGSSNDICTVPTTSGTDQSAPAHCGGDDDDDDDGQYARVQFRMKNKEQAPAKPSSQEEDDGDVQYASVQFKKSQPESPQSITAQEETLYASVNHQRLSAATQAEGESDIYSNINKKPKP